MPDVFHMPGPVPDAELADLLRSLPDGPSREQRVAHAMASAVDGQSGKQPSVDVTGMQPHQKQDVAVYLASHAAQARADGHEAADRLADVAAKWASFAGTA